jgi:hypothetical protein
MVVLNDHELYRTAPPALGKTTISCENIPLFQFRTANQVLIFYESFIGHVKPKDPEPLRQFPEHGVRNKSTGFFHESQFRFFQTQIIV